MLTLIVVVLLIWWIDHLDQERARELRSQSWEPQPPREAPHPTTQISVPPPPPAPPPAQGVVLRPASTPPPPVVLAVSRVPPLAAVDSAVPGTGSAGGSHNPEGDYRGDRRRPESRLEERLARGFQMMRAPETGDPYDQDDRSWDDSNDCA